MKYYNLSNAQMRIYIDQIFYPESNFANICYTLTGAEIDNTDVVKNALNAVIRENDAIRLKFTQSDGEILQYIEDYLEHEFEVMDFESPECNEYAEWVRLKTNEKMELYNSEMFYFAIIKFKKGACGLFIKFHHLVHDGFSAYVFIDKLEKHIYSNNKEKTETQERRSSYIDFVDYENEYLKSEKAVHHKKYWIDKFIPAPEENPLFAGKNKIKNIECGTKNFFLTNELNEKINDFCAKLKITHFTFFMSLLASYFSKISGLNDVVMGFPHHGRSGAGARRMCGMFVSTIPFRINIDENISFQKMAEGISKEIKEISREYYQYPFNNIAEELKDKKCELKNVLDINLVEVPDIKKAGFNLKFHVPDQDPSLFTLYLKPGKFEDSPFELIFTFRKELFTPSEIDLAFGRLIFMALQVIENPELLTKNICILPENERRKVLIDFNDTGAEFPLHKTAHELFCEAAAAHPEKTALVFKGQKYTYAQLDEITDRLANYLRKKGVKPNTVCGILVKRSEDIIISLLGILKAGGGYLPIDPGYPDDRILYMLEDSGAVALVGHSELRERVSGFKGEFICVDKREFMNESSAKPENINKPEDLVYVIYTSGSTGKPKGVMIEHRNLVNLCRWQNKFHNVTSADTAAAYSGFSFDASVWEMLPFITCGACLHIIADELRLDIDGLNEYFNLNNITITNLPTQFCEQFMESVDNRSLKTLVTGGDKLRSFKPSKFRLVNEYGPTEYTISATAFLVDKYYDNIPIGKPLSNTWLYVVDKNSNPVPIGIPGELWISGAQIARGYLNRPELTAAKFVANPFKTCELNSRLYKTGDLVRWTISGDIEFLGRIDQQVKIRGYRIELGEIEQQLLKVANVKDAVVIDIADQSGNKYLSAYIVTKNGNMDRGSIKNSLLKELPEYMVPSYFTMIEKIPLTPNGKIDRRALPEPDLKPVEFEHIEPRTELEKQLAGLWCEILKLEKIGVRDNFFSLGGHSLKASMLQSKIQKNLRVKISLADIFENPVLENLANFIKGLSFCDLPPVKSEPPIARNVLTNAQMSIYILSGGEDSTAGYNIPLVNIITGEIDRYRLENAIKTIIGRHEILRARFEPDAKFGASQIIEKEVFFKLDYFEPDDLEKISGCPTLNSAGSREDFINSVSNFFIRKFDLSAAPLLKAILIKTDLNEYVFILNVHHIIFDGASAGIFIDELVRLYNGETLPEPKFQYKDYIGWSRQFKTCPAYKNQEKYWLNVYKNSVSPLNLNTDFPRPPFQSFNGRKYYFTLEKNLFEGIKRLAADNGVTLYHALLAAWYVLLYRYSGQEDIVVGTPVAGRPHADLENVVGMFVNTIAMRGFPHGEQSFLEFLKQTKDMSLAAIDNQHYEFFELVNKLNIRRDGSRNPLFDVLFVLQNAGDITCDTDKFKMRPWKFQNNSSQVDLTLEAEEIDGNLELLLEYCTDLFRPETITRMAVHYINILAAAVNDGNISLDKIEMPDAPVKVQLWNNINGSESTQASSISEKTGYAEPRNEREKLLVSIWQEVLFAKKIGIYDNFFALGGDSIKSIQIAVRLKKHNLKLDTKKIFAAPTIASLAGCLEETNGAANNSPVCGLVPLTPIQSWFFNQKFKAQNHWNQSAIFSSGCPIDQAVLSAALGDIVIHHDALRMIFNFNENGIEQYNRNINEGEFFKLNVYSLKSAADGEEALNEITALSDELQKGIDLKAGILLRAGLFKGNQAGNVKDYVVIVIHHLVVDGVSWEIIHRDLEAAYKARLENKKPDFAHKTDSYKEWSEKLLQYSKSQKILDKVSYWKNIDAVNVDLLPVDKISNESRKLENIELVFGPEETSNLLTAVQSAYGLTLEEALIAGLASSLWNWSGGGIRNTAITLEGHGREETINANVMRTIGWFTATYPVVISGAAGDIGGVMKNIKENIRHIPDHGFDYEIIHTLTPSEMKKDCHNRLLSEIEFNYLGEIVNNTKETDGKIFNLIDIGVGNDSDPIETPDFKLYVSASTSGGALSISIDYDSGLYYRETIEKLALFYKNSLEEMVLHCSGRAREYTISDIADKKLTNDEFQAVKAIYGENIEKIYPLAPMQAGMIFFNLMSGKHSSDYLEQSVYLLNGEMDETLFTENLSEMIKHYDILRTGFVVREIETMRQVVLREVAPAIRFYDFTNLSDDRHSEKIEEISAEERRSGFDLKKPPLLKAAVLKFSGGKNIVILSFLHTILDGWSVEFIEDFMFYDYFRIKKGIPVEHKPVPPYGNYINWLESQDREEAFSFWRNYLSGLSKPTLLPKGRLLREEKLHLFKDKNITLSKELTGQLQALAREHGVTLGIIMQALWGIMLMRYNESNDATFGLVVSGRGVNLQGIEDIPGLFINTIPVRVKAEDTMTFISLVKAMQENSIRADKYSYVSLADIQAQSKLRGGLINTLFTFQFVLNKTVTVPDGFELKEIDGFDQINYDFSVVIFPYDEMSIRLNYDSGVYEDFFADIVAGNLEELINEVLAEPDGIIGKYDFISGAEKYLMKKISNSEAPSLKLPFDKPKAISENAGYESYSFDFNEASIKKLKNILCEKNLYLHDLLIAALNITLHKYTGDEDITILSPAAQDWLSGDKNGNDEKASGNVVEIRNYPSPSKKIIDFAAEINEHIGVINEQLNYFVLPDKTAGNGELPQTASLKLMFRYESGGTAGENNNFIGDYCPGLSFIVRENSDGLKAELTYLNSMFAKQTIERIASHIIKVLDEAALKPDKKIQDICVLTEIEKNKILCEFNSTLLDVPLDKTISELFAEAAAEFPERTALVFKDKKYSYKQLNEITDRLAAYLSKKGVKKDTISAILVKRSEDIIIAMLGIMKAGGAYLPIDPAYPDDRIMYMLEDSDAVAVLGHSELKDRVSGFKGEWIGIDAREYMNENSMKPEKVCAADNIAYVIYTSGSTGKPKGVMVEHKNIVNLCKWHNKFYGITESDCSAAYSGFSFDASIWEMVPFITRGAAVHILAEELRLSLEKLNEYFKENNVTITNLPTQLCEQFMENITDCPLNTMVTGGDKLRFYKPSRFKLVNEYGPTEYTISSTAFAVDKIYDNIPIGKPLANTWAYIVDKNSIPVPIGVPGELWVSGAQLSRGYLNRPELTAEKFIDNPFKTCELNAKAYRTGDLVRWTETGDIEFLGRIDQQVKIRGYRIELGEIEQQFLKIAGIKDCVVTDMNDAAGGKYLSAYITASDGIDINYVKTVLARELPDYMLPSYFTILDKIPLTPNGKVDKKSLPVPDINVSGSEYVAPSTENEIEIAEAWRVSLGLEKVGARDNFFAIGGNSIKAIMVVSKLSKSFEVTIEDIFKFPTLAALAADLKRKIPSENVFTGEIVQDLRDAVIQHAPKKEYYALSYSQKRMFVLDRMQEDNSAYHITAALMLEGALDKNKLSRAVDIIVKRHESLRTSFEIIDGEPVQKINKTIKLKKVFKKIEESEIEYSVNEFVRNFDLEKPPLIRILLLEISKNKHLFVMDVHHIIVDGLSLEIFYEELFKIYNGIELEPVQYQYKDYSEWENGEFFQKALADKKKFWLKTFENEIPVLNMPYDFSRPAVKSADGDVVFYNIDAETTKILRKIALENQTTMFMVLLAAVNVLLHKYSGNEDIVLGTPCSGRTNSNLEKVMGMFVSTIPVRNYPAASKTFREFLAEVKKNSIDSFNNQEYPFDQLVEALNVKRDPSKNPIFDIMFSYDVNGGFDFKGLKVSSYDAANKLAQFDLTFDACDSGDIINLALEYSVKLFKKDTIERMAGHIGRILNEITLNPDICLKDINILCDGEKNKILNEFNSTFLEVPADKTIHELFAEAVSKYPEKTALVYKDKKYTYGELDALTNRLAAYLRKKGVKPGTVNAILVDRSEDIVIAMLGIIKAGGAYLPIDPAYPDDRIMYMLEDSGAVAVLGQSALAGRVNDFKGIFINLDSREYMSESPEMPINLNRPDDLLYVIYTSGSTGKPKGVMIEHKNLVNLCKWHNKFHGITADDNAAAYSGFSFDASIWEMTPFITCGAALHIIADELRLSPEKLNDYFNKNNITITNLPTQFCEQFMESAENHSLKTLVTGGDKLRSYKPSNFRLVNEYGPTEYTISATAFAVDKLYDNIPIGKPLANTWLYVVDKYSSPVPVGVPGELWIAGAQIARGYLNRPELTAEKFIDNPFKTCELNAKAYKTGDLVKWNSEGNIEFLGRIDQQVKIRGYRIELGEIEQQLMKISDIGNAVVIDQNDPSGNKYLAAYLVSVSGANVDIAAVKKNIAKELPDYMVPSYFTQLDKIPLTPNGKIDKKSLPVPEFKKVKSEYIEPASENEIKAAKIWKEVLGLEKISAGDNFFELGGNSIKAIAVVSKLSKSFDISINDIFEHQVLSDLAVTIKPKQNNLKIKLAEIMDENALAENDITKSPEYLKEYEDALKKYSENNLKYSKMDFSKRKSYENVLLTGATGFLGIHVMRHLLINNSCSLTVIVRGKNNDDACERVKSKIRYYFGEGIIESAEFKRINVYCGDLSKENLGLADADYKKLAENTDAVIHTAANVRHYGHYNEFYNDNVVSTLNLLKFAKTSKFKDFNHVSTVSVGSGNIDGRDFVIYTENDVDCGQVHDNYYLKTKLLAEKEVAAARSEGINANIFRVGNIVFNSETGLYQENIDDNAFYNQIKSYLNIGAVPEQLDEAEFSFVDYVASAICKLFDCAEIRNEVFHLWNPETVKLSELLSDKSLGLNIDKLNLRQFVDHLYENFDRKGMAKYIEQIMTHLGWLDDSEKSETYFTVLSEKTEMILKKAGFEWPRLETGKLGLMIKKAFAERIEFLKSIPLFASFGHEDIAQIAGISRQKVFKNSEDLLWEGVESNEFYVIVDGYVEICRNSVDGWTGTLLVAGSESVIGEENLVLNKPSSITVESIMGDSLVLSFSFDRIRDRIMNNPKILTEMLKLMADKITRLEKIIVSMG